MFEKQISAILFSYLKQFIANLNEEQLQLSLWSGCLTLKNLELQPTALDEVSELLKGNAAPHDSKNASNGNSSQLPFTLGKGLVKELRIAVPWSTLDREPLCIEVNGLDIFLTALRARPYSPAEEEARSKSSKKVQLQRFEAKATALKLYGKHSSAADDSSDLSLFSSANFDGSPTISSPKGFLEQLQEKIVRNILLVFRDVNISYQVDYIGLCPSLATGFSISVEEVMIVNTDESFHDRFVYDLTLPLCRRAHILGFSLAVFSGKKVSEDHEPHVPDQQSQNSTGMPKRKDMISTSFSYPEESSHWHYHSKLLMVPECSIHFLLRQNSHLSSETDICQCHFLVPTKIEINTSFAALVALKNILISLQNSGKAAPFRKFLHLLHESGTSPVSLASKRWRFAIRCVMSQNASRRRRHFNSRTNELEEMILFCRIRRQYCELYKRFLKVPWLSPLNASEIADLFNIEQSLPLESILFLRSFARAEVAEEEKQIQLQKVYVRAAEARAGTKNNLNSSRVSSFLSRLGWSKGNGEEKKTEVADSHEELVESSLSLGDLVEKNKTTVSTSYLDEFSCALDSYWQCSKKILATELAFASLKDPEFVNSLKGTPFADLSSHMSWTLSINIDLTVINVLPNYYGLDGVSRTHGVACTLSPSFLQRIQQKLSMTSKKTSILLEYSEASDVRCCVSVKSVESKFIGIRTTPLFLSDISSSTEDFLHIMYSPQESSVEIQSTTTVLYPNHELFWWRREVEKGLELWNYSLSKDFFMASSFSSTNNKSGGHLTHVWKARIHSFSVVIPLSHHEFMGDPQILADEEDLNSSRRSLTLTQSLSDLGLVEEVESLKPVSVFDSTPVGNRNAGTAHDSKIIIVVPTLTCTFGDENYEEDKASDGKCRELLHIFTEDDVIVSCHDTRLDGRSCPVYVDVIRISPLLIHYCPCDLHVNFVYLSSASVALERSALALVNDFLVNPLFAMNLPKDFAGITPGELHRQLWELRSRDEWIAFDNPLSTCQWSSDTCYDSISALCEIYFSSNADFDNEFLAAFSTKQEGGISLDSSSICLVLGSVTAEFRGLDGNRIAAVEMMERETADILNVDKSSLTSLLASPHAFHCHFNLDGGSVSSAHLFHVDLTSDTGKTIVALHRLVFFFTPKDQLYEISLDKLTLGLDRDMIPTLSFILSSVSSLIPFEPAVKSKVLPFRQTYTIRIAALSIDIPLLSRVEGIPNTFLYSCISSILLQAIVQEETVDIEVEAVIDRVEKREELGMHVMEYQILSASENFVGDVRSPCISAKIKKSIMSNQSNAGVASIRFTGGQFSIYFPLLFELQLLSEDSFYVNLLNVFQESSILSGLTFRGEEWKEEVRRILNSADQPPLDDTWTIESTIKEVELFVATNASVPIDLSSSETYFFMYLSQAELFGRTVAASSSASNTFLKAHIQGLFYFPSYSPFQLSPLVNDVETTVHQSISNKKVSCDIKTTISDNNSNASEMWLTVPQLASLLEVFNFNWMVYPPPVPVNVEYERYVMETFVPKFLLVIQSDTKTALSLSFPNGIRFLIDSITYTISINELKIGFCSFPENSNPSFSDFSAALEERNDSVGSINTISAALEIPFLTPSQCELEPSSCQCALAGVKFSYNTFPFFVLSKIVQELSNSQVPVKIRKSKKQEQYESSVNAYSFSTVGSQETVVAQTLFFNRCQFSLRDFQLSFFGPQDKKFPLLRMTLPAIDAEAMQKNNNLERVDLTISQSEVFITESKKDLDPRAVDLRLEGKLISLEKLHCLVTPVCKDEVKTIGKEHRMQFPFLATVDVQSPSGNFSFNHLRQLVAYGSQELHTLHQLLGKNFSMVPPSGLSTPEETAEEPSLSVFLLQEIRVNCSHLCVSLHQYSLHISRITFHQTNVLRSKLTIDDSYTEGTAFDSAHSSDCKAMNGESEIFCIVPELEVKDCRIFVGTQKEKLCLPDICLCITYPIYTSCLMVVRRPSDSGVLGTNSSSACSDGESPSVSPCSEESFKTYMRPFPSLLHSYEALLQVKYAKVAITEFFLRSLVLAYMDDQASFMSLLPRAEEDTGGQIFDDAEGSEMRRAPFHGKHRIECPSLDIILEKRASTFENPRLGDVSEMLEPMLITRISCSSSVILFVTESCTNCTMNLQGKCEAFDGRMKQIVSLKTKEAEETERNEKGVSLADTLAVVVKLEKDVHVSFVLDTVQFFCNAAAVDLLIQFKDFYFEFTEMISSRMPSVAVEQASGVHFVAPFSTKLTIKGNICNISMNVEDIAVLSVEGVLFTLENLNTMWLPSQEPGNQDICALHFGPVVLTDLSNTSKYIEISSGDLKVEIGSVSMRVQHVIANHFEGYSVIAYRIAELQQYVIQKLELPKRIDRGFERKVVLTVISIEARFAEYSAHSTAEKGYLRICSPVLVLREVSTAQNIQYLVDVENTSVDYFFCGLDNGGSQWAALSILEKWSASLKYEANLIKQTRAVGVRLGKCFISVPIGQKLNGCTGSVLKTLLTFTAEAARTQEKTFYAEHTEVLSPDSKEAFKFLQHTEALSSEQWAETKVTFHNSELQLILLSSHSSISSVAPSLQQSTILVNAFLAEYHAQSCSETFLVEVQALTSTTHQSSSIKSPFLAASPRSRAVDPQCRKGVHIRVEREVSLSSSQGEEKPTPLEIIRVTGRLNNFMVALSPEWLLTVRDEILHPVSSSVHQVCQEIKRRNTIHEHSGPCIENKHFLSLPNREGVVVEGNVIVISSDHCLSTNLFIGGVYGMVLHFRKNRNAKVVNNLINLSSVPGVKIIVSPMESPSGKPLQRCIIVDEGLTVNIIHTPLYLGSHPLESVVLLGERSFFHIEEKNVKNPQCSAESLAFQKVHYPSPRHLRKRVAQRVDIDLSADIDFTLWSKFDKMSLSTAVIAKYYSERVFTEGSADMGEFTDENGKIEVRNLVIESNGSPMTDEHITIAMDVKHGSLEGSEGGISTVEVQFPSTSLSVTLGQLKLLFRTHIELFKCLESFLKEFSNEEISSTIYSSVYQPVAPALKSSASSDVVSMDDRVPRSSSRSQLSLCLSAPSVTITLNDDLGGKIGVLSFLKSSCDAKGQRNLGCLTCQLHSEITASDFPFPEKPRVLLSCAPQIVSSHNWYAEDSVTAEVAVTCRQAICTVPLLTLTKLYHAHLKRDLFHEPFTLHNFLGKTVTILWPSGECTVLETGCSTAIEQRYRTSFCYVLLGDAVDFVNEHSLEAKRTSSCVDFAILREKKSYRFPQIRTESLGVLDTVFLLRSSQRQLHITSSVMFKNCLQNFPVELSDNQKYLPGEEVYVALDTLLLPFQLRVNGYERRLKPPQQVTWDTLISAFVVLPDHISRDTVLGETSGEAFRTIEGNTMRLTFVLTKPAEISKDTESMLICLVLKKFSIREKLSLSPSILQKFDVHVTLEAVYSIINVTGGSVEFSMESDEKFVRVAHNEIADLFPSEQRMEIISTLKLHFRFSSTDESGAVYSGTLCLSDVPHNSERFLPLISSSNQMELAVIVKHHTLGKLFLQTVGVIQNSVPYSLVIQLTRGSICAEAVRLSPGAQTPIHVPFKSLVNEVSSCVDEPVYMKIALDSGSSEEVYAWSDVYLCNTSIPPTALTTAGDKKSLHVLIRSQNIPSSAGSLVHLVEILPKWCFKNVLPIPLEMRVACCDAEIILIPSGESRSLVEFPSFSAIHPSIQIRLLYSQEPCSWSAPFSVVDLCAFGAVTNWKYRLPENVGSSDHLPFLEVLRVPTHPNSPMKEERFLNLFLIPSVEYSQCVVEVGVDTVMPIVIENRIGIPLQVRQLPPSSASTLSSSSEPLWAYFVPAHSDTGFSFDILTRDPQIRIDLLGERTRSYVLLSGFGDLAVFEEIQKLGPFFVGVTAKQDTSVTSYIVTVAQNPILQRRLLSSSHCVVHLDILVESLSVYVSSAWCYKDMTKSSMHHFLSMISQGAWRLSCGYTDKISVMSEEEAILALQTSELDLFLLQITGLYLSALQNEKHILGNLSLGRTEVVDCTSPHPLHPVVLSIIGSKDDGAESTRRKIPDFRAVGGAAHYYPCLTVSYHLIYPRRVPSPTTHFPLNHNVCVKVVLKNLSADVGEVCVRLQDNFLYTVTSAVKRIFELQYSADAGSMEPLISSACFSSKPAEPSPCTYDFSLQNVFVSSIRFRLTLSRRSDGILNPFEDLSSLLGFIVPSIDNAPINFPSWHLNGYNVRSTQAIVFLTDVVLPAYRTPAIFQFYKVVGSLEMLGNPVALVSGWSRAVRSLIVGAASLDLVSGTQDFLREATSSTLHSVQLLSHFGSRVTSKLALDDHWTTEQEYGSVDGQSSSLSLTKGVTKGIVDGVGSVFQKPFHGVRERGVPGLLSGVAGGMAVLLSRPLSGALRSVGDTAQFFSLCLEKSDAPLSMVSTYLETQRNFLPEIIFKETPLGEFTVSRQFVDGDFMTIDEFDSLGLSDDLKDCTSSFFDTVAARIGMHNILLYGPSHSLVPILSEKDLYSSIELMIAGDCARIWLKEIKTVKKLHSETEEKEKNAEKCTNDSIENKKSEFMRDNISLIGLKERASLAEFKECCPILLDRVTQGFTNLLSSSASL